VAPKPPTLADLEWIDNLKFRATSGRITLTIDGESTAGPSPVQALAFALSGCMSADVIDILRKGRYGVRAFKAHLAAERAPENPHRFVKVDLRFSIAGTVPASAVERAIALSRDKYCSVWHSMQPDIDFTTSYEISA
jgi:putative redox protein